MRKTVPGHDLYRNDEKNYGSQVMTVMMTIIISIYRLFLFFSLFSYASSFPFQHLLREREGKINIESEHAGAAGRAKAGPLRAPGLRQCRPGSAGGAIDKPCDTEGDSAG